jgi:hypothetical protein
MTQEENKRERITDWCKRIIHGSGGFLNWEDREWIVFHTSREQGIAEFVIRCLANPLCEGSDKVLEKIMKARTANHPTMGDQVEFIATKLNSQPSEAVSKATGQKQ